MAQLMKGIELSSKILAAVKEETGRLAKHGIRPGLALVLVARTSLPICITRLSRALPPGGIDIFNHTLPATVSLNEILNVIKTLNNDETCQRDPRVHAAAAPYRYTEGRECDRAGKGRRRAGRHLRGQAFR